VSFNRLRVIYTFAGLTALRYLDASHNEFDELAPELTESLRQLEHLDLSYNRIPQLPDHFGELRRLRYLILSHNVIAEFPNDRMDVLSSVRVCPHHLAVSSVVITAALVTILLPFDCSSTALRPFDNLRRDRVVALRPK